MADLFKNGSEGQRGPARADAGKAQDKDSTQSTVKHRIGQHQIAIMSLVRDSKGRSAGVEQGPVSKLDGRVQDATDAF